MSWDPFLIKFLLEKKIFGSCEQYMGSTRKTEKPYKCASQKKKKELQNVNTAFIISIQTGTMGLFGYHLLLKTENTIAK